VLLSGVTLPHLLGWHTADPPGWQRTIDSIPALLIQLILVGVFPGFYIVEANLAYYLIFDRNPNSKVGDSLRRQQALASSPLFADRICYLRARYYLAILGQPRFWRRLGFATLLGLWSTFFFLTLSRPIKGVDNPVFAYDLPLLHYNMPVMAAGFSGFYIYALSGLIYRHRTGNISLQMLQTLLVRGIISIMICAVLALAPSEFMAPIAIAFFVGIIPDSVVKLISDIAKMPGVRFAVDPASFRDLPSIDLWKGIVLEELGVTDIHELATTDLSRLLVRVGINPVLLVRAVDRAILLETFRPQSSDQAVAPQIPQVSDPIAQLAKVPVYTASDLVLELMGKDAYYKADCPDKVSDPTRAIVGHLCSEDKNARLKSLQDGVQLTHLREKLEELATNANVSYIIVNKLTHHDL
jgi:hypothetical protein